MLLLTDAFDDKTVKNMVSLRYNKGFFFKILSQTKNIPKYHILLDNLYYIKVHCNYHEFNLLRVR